MAPLTLILISKLSSASIMSLISLIYTIYKLKELLKRLQLNLITIFAILFDFTLIIPRITCYLGNFSYILIDFMIYI